jgi:uncharacterized protein (DUF2062 family)
MWRRWGAIRQLKLLLLRFVRLQGTPHEISKGIALGICIGMTPTFGIQMPLAILFAWMLRESKVAAVLGVWITNPLTAPFIYAVEYETGLIMLQQPHAELPQTFTFDTFSQLGWEVLFPLGLGSLLWAVLSWGVAYYICLKLSPMARKLRVARWPRKRKDKLRK